MVSENSNYTTQQYLAGIRDNDRVVQKCIVREFLPKIKQFIRKSGGTARDGEDMFQDAMEAIFRKTKFEGLTDLRCTFFNFVCEICKRLWYKKMRVLNRYAEVTPEELMVFTDSKEDPQLALEETERHGLMWETFQKLGKDCRRLLELALLAEKKAEEIARLMGYGSASYTRKRKRQCISKWKEFIQENPRFGELRI